MRHRFTHPFTLAAAALALLAALPAFALSLDDLAHQLAAEGDVSGRFEQRRYLADLDTHIEGHGRYRFEQGERVVWQLEAPVEETMTLSDEGISRNGAPIEDDPAGVATLIMQLLSGRLSALENRFDIALSGSETQWAADLVPRRQALAEYLESIAMRGGERLERVTLHMADGDRLDIRLRAGDPALAGASGR